MKKYTKLAIAPVLALMAAACSSPIAMQSTEYDDMYYSSSDKTVFVEPRIAASEQAYQRYEEETGALETERALAEGEVLNPEYSGNAITNNYYTDEYYDGRAYNPRDNWYRPNYSFVDPFWGAGYLPRRNSFAYYDPFFDPFFYDPFYDPFWGRPLYGNGLNISLGYGMGMGGGFYNRPFFNRGGWWPNSYGFGGYYNGFYNGMYASNPYFNPYFGNGFYDRPTVVSKPVQYGPRDSRGGIVTEGAAAGRPVRGEAFDGGSTAREAVGQSTRRGESTTRTQESRRELPTRPSRRGEINRGSQNQSGRERIIIQPREQRATPSRENRRSREATPRQEYRQQQRETRTRSYESRPTRSYEQSNSFPSRSSEQRSSFGNSSSSWSGGGGRPSRGN